jgi:hypothetical protein
MTKKKLDLKDAISYIKSSSLIKISNMNDKNLALYLESLLFRYVYWKQPYLDLPLSCLGTYEDLAIACVPEARLLLSKRCLEQS